MSEKPSVFEAFSRVMGDVRAIEKKERNAQQNFLFRGIDTITEAVGPVLREHGVFIIPSPISLESETYQTSKGTQMRNVTVQMQYTVYGPQGDCFIGGAYGESADAGDKAVTKAQSVAYRTFLLQGLTIPTRSPDPDAASHERAARSKPRKDPSFAAKEKLRALIDEIGIEPDEAMDKFRELGHGELGESADVKAINDLYDHYMNQAGRS